MFSHQAGLAHKETPPLPANADYRNQTSLCDEAAVLSFLHAERVGIKPTPLLCKARTVPWDLNMVQA